MQLNFLGTGSAYNPAEGNNGAYFLRGEDLFLLDCGESCFSALMRRGLLDRPGGRLTILLTHLHSDHCGALGTTCLYAQSRLNRLVTVVHPHEQARALLSLMGVSPDRYRLLDALDEGGVRAEPVPVRHLGMPAFGYLLSDESETIYYSGDATDIPDAVLDGLRQGRVRRVYQDCAHDGTPRREHPAHMPFALLCERVEPALRSRVTLMHFNRDFSAEAETVGFVCAVARH